MFEKFKSQTALKIYGITALSVAFVCVVLRIISMLSFFDKSIGYFERGAALPIISSLLAALAVLASVVFCLIPKIKVNPIPAAHTRASNICAVFAVLGFAFFSVKSFLGVLSFAQVYGFAQIPPIYYVDIIASVGACAFFVLKFIGKAGANAASVICGLLAVVWFVISLVDCYFNQSMPMNSPLKLVFQYACLAAMLLCVNEMRIGVDTKRTGFQLFSATFAAIYLPLSSIPSIVCYLCDGMPLTYSLIYSDIIILLVSVFAIARLVQMCFCKPHECPSEAVDNTQETTEEVQE